MLKARYFVFLFIGLTLLLFIEDIKKSFVTNEKSPPLAQVIDINGTKNSTLVKNPKMLDRILKKGNSVFSLDTITTGPYSKVVLDLTSQGKLEIEPNSKVSFETMHLQGGYLLIKWISGNITFLKEPNYNRTKVFRVKDAFSFESPSLQGQRAIQKKQQSTYQKKITQTVKSHISLFDKCHIMLLKEQRISNEEIEIYFEILSSGQIQNVKTYKSRLSNSNFNTCLEQVFTRMSFPQHTDRVKKVIYPLQFGYR